MSVAFNPFQCVVGESPYTPYSRLLRENFDQRLRATWEVIYGTEAGYKRSRQLGVTDYLLVLPFFIRQSKEWSYKHRTYPGYTGQVARLIYPPLFIAYCAIEFIKGIASLCLTITSIPFVMIAHAMFSYLAKQYWEDALNLKCRYQDKEYYLRDLYDLDELRGQDDSTISSITQNSFHLCKTWGANDYVFDKLTADPEQKKSMRALLHLNLFNLGNRFDDIQLARFKGCTPFRVKSIVKYAHQHLCSYDTEPHGYAETTSEKDFEIKLTDDITKSFEDICAEIIEQHSHWSKHVNTLNSVGNIKEKIEIQCSGELNGKPFEMTFDSIDGFKDFLREHQLLPDIIQVQNV